MKFTCTKCQSVNTVSDKKIARHLASKAGKSGTGKAKARAPEKMRQAALKSWIGRRKKPLQK